MNEFDNFQKLMDAFKRRKYKISETVNKDIDKKIFFTGWASNKKIRAMFATSNNKGTYPDWNGKIVIDRADIFNKWKKCPICLPLPETPKQIKFLFDKIKWLLTDEGKKVSNSFDYENYITSYK